jgi:hypothetical protein
LQLIIIEQLNKLKNKRTIILVAEDVPSTLLVDQTVLTDLQEWEA